MGRVLNFVVISYISFRSIIDLEEGATPIGGVCVSDTNCDSRYSDLVRLLVSYQVCNVFEFESVLIC